MQSDPSRQRLRRDRQKKIWNDLIIKTVINFFILNCHRLGGVPKGRDNFPF
jgi:hypothetical protein